jgi:hypothetical protein
LVTIIHHIQDAIFNGDSTKDYNLSLLIGTDRLSYLVVAPESKKLLLLKSYSLDAKVAVLPQLSEIYAQDIILQSTFEKVELCLHTRRFCIVPDSLYRESKKAEYLQVQLSLSAQDVVLANRIHSIDAQVIYAIGADFYEWVTNNFKQAEIYCVSAGIINNLIGKKADDEYKITTLWQSRSFQLTIVQKGKLILHQVYHFFSAEDALYYILLAYQQLGLSRERHTLWIAGDLVSASEIYKNLHIYIRNIEFVSRPEILQYSDNISKLPPHFYYDLYCSTLCASSAES